MHSIDWSALAKKDYWDNIDYILLQWSHKEAINFIEEVENILLIISRNPKTFQSCNYKKTHQVPINPQITLYYRIKNKKIVELIRFWNNYQNPRKLKL